MFRLFTRGIAAIQQTASLTPFALQNGTRICPSINQIVLNKFSSLSLQQNAPALLANPKLLEISTSISLQSQRNVTKFSWGKGKRKTVSAVLKRFYRLDWGGWIHGKCGRNKKLWKKHPARKRRLRQHVLCNASQSLLLDKMVNNYWRKPKYYVDDPYAPYHQREEFIYTYKKPKEYIPLPVN